MYCEKKHLALVFLVSESSGHENYSLSNTLYWVPYEALCIHNPVEGSQQPYEVVMVITIIFQTGN